MNYFQLSTNESVPLFKFNIKGIDLLAKIIAIFHLTYFSYILLKNYFDKREFFEIIRQFKMNIRDINNQCPICLENLIDETKLLCNHSFCAKCIFLILDLKNLMIKCPVCRKKSILLIIRFKPNINNNKYFKALNYHNKIVLKKYKTCICLCYNNFRDFSKKSECSRRRCLIFDFLIDIIIWILPYIEENDNWIIIGILVFYFTLIILLMVSIYLLTSRRLEFENFVVKM